FQALISRISIDRSRPVPTTSYLANSNGQVTNYPYHLLPGESKRTGHDLSLPPTNYHLQPTTHYPLPTTHYLYQPKSAALLFSSKSVLVVHFEINRCLSCNPCERSGQS